MATKDPSTFLSDAVPDEVHLLFWLAIGSSNHLSSLQVLETIFGSFLATVWQMCQIHLKISKVKICGIRIHFLLLLCCMVFVPMSLPQSLAASLGESHCNQACYESVEHFCKQIFSAYVCMKCKGVCTNEDSQSDRDICHQNCQGSQYYPKLPSTTRAIATTPNSSTLKLSTPKPSIPWMETSLEVVASTVGSIFEGSTSATMSDKGSNSSYGFLVGSGIIACFFIPFVLWLLCCAFPSARKGDPKTVHPSEKQEADSTSITASPVAESTEDNNVYQTGRPPRESIPSSPSDQMQEEAPDFPVSNKAKKKGSAEWDITQNPVFHPEDEDSASMALPPDPSRILSATVQEGNFAE